MRQVPSNKVNVRHRRLSLTAPHSTPRVSESDKSLGVRALHPAVEPLLFMVQSEMQGLYRSLLRVPRRSSRGFAPARATCDTATRSVALSSRIGYVSHGLANTRVGAGAARQHARMMSGNALEGLCSHLSFPGLDGGAVITPQSLSAKVVLLVNTASYCGYTPQLAGLQRLQELYGKQGLVVLAVPSNDFGAQEPDSESRIAAFYRGPPYGATYTITSKQAVIGAAAHPAYRWLADNLGDAGTPSWNFSKYLLGRDGSLVGLFAPAADPLSPEVTQAIEQALQ